MWHHLGVSEGSFQRYVSPQRDQSQHGPHFTDEQMEARAPCPVWPFIFAVNTIYLLSIDCARPWVGTGGSEMNHTQALPSRHSEPGRAVGHVKGHSRYSVVSVVLEVAQVMGAGEHRGGAPGPAGGWQEGFLEEVTPEEGFRE